MAIKDVMSGNIYYFGIKRIFMVLSGFGFNFNFKLLALLNLLINVYMYMCVCVVCVYFFLIHIYFWLLAFTDNKAEGMTCSKFPRAELNLHLSSR